MLKNFSKQIFMITGLIISIHSPMFAAESDSKNVTIFIVNEATRAIKQMTSFQSLEITADDRDQGYSDLNGNDLVIQSNDTYKIQGRITGNTLSASMKIGDGAITPISSSYTDLFDEGQANPSATHPVLLRFGVGWETPAGAENVTLHLKGLSRT